MRWWPWHKGVIVKIEKLGAGKETSQRIDVHIHNEMVESGVSAKLDQILTMLGVIKAQNERILVNEAEMKTALTRIDVATTAAGTNLSVIGDVMGSVSDNVTAMGTAVGTISTEMDALIAKLLDAGVPQELVDQATGLGAKADAIVTASEAVVTAANAAKNATTALVPVLNGIAAKGENVVPIPVPPPPPPPVLPVL